jgi:hypothetical protein
MVFGSNRLNESSGGSARPKTVGDGSGQHSQIRKVRVDVNTDEA